MKDARRCRCRCRFRCRCRRLRLASCVGRRGAFRPARALPWGVRTERSWLQQATWASPRQPRAMTVRRAFHLSFTARNVCAARCTTGSGGSENTGDFCNLQPWMGSPNKRKKGRKPAPVRHLHIVFRVFRVFRAFRILWALGMSGVRRINPTLWIPRRRSCRPRCCLPDWKSGLRVVRRPRA